MSAPTLADLTRSTLAQVQHAGLRAQADGALARGERAQLAVGDLGGTRVETLVLVALRRAFQSAGGSVIEGDWSGGRLVTDQGGHQLDLHGVCTCPSCETAAGLCGDDDE